MFREFEFVMWTCFCQTNKIKELVTEFADPSLVEAGKKHILNHLVHTAYYCKTKTTSADEFQAYKAFFNQEFSIFEGRHTEWLLMDEPVV